MPAVVVDDLRVDVLVACGARVSARTLGRAAHAVADAERAAAAGGSRRCSGASRLTCSAAHEATCRPCAGRSLARVADALALVGLGRARAGGSRAANCPTACLSAPLMMMSVGFGHSTVTPLRDLEHGRALLKPTLSVSFLPLDRGLVADADDLEPLLVALGHAVDHVLERARASRPWSARCRCASPCRATSELAALDASRRCPRAARDASSPFGPLTVDACGPSTATVDAGGDRRSGCLPMRDMGLTRPRRGLRRRRFCGAGLAVGEDALAASRARRCRGRAAPAGCPVDAAVDAAAGLADALDRA